MESPRILLFIPALVLAVLLWGLFLNWLDEKL